jgi:hypothetical protein
VGLSSFLYALHTESFLYKSNNVEVKRIRSLGLNLTLVIDALQFLKTLLRNLEIVILIESSLWPTEREECTWQNLGIIFEGAFQAAYPRWGKFRISNVM